MSQEAATDDRSFVEPSSEPVGDKRVNETGMLSDIVENPPRRFVVCLVLAIAVMAIYAQTLRFGFLAYDDGLYVVENPHVRTGLNWTNLVWAFTSVHATNWHPLTWMSHMLDAALFGSWPGGHHLTNALLHALTACLLFLTLLELTTQYWPSAIVAAVFAVHPLRVESVAWVAERKDVLSGLFFALTLFAYTKYVRQPSWGRYGAVVLALFLGLLAKPMLVTVPCVLLLLDYWPLDRFAVQNRRLRRVLLEKAPLFALAILSVVATLWAQREEIDAFQALSLSTRLENAVLSYVIYVRQMLLPIGLVVLYPHPTNGIPTWKVIGAVIFVLALSVAAVARRRTQRYLFVGWFWYLGMLAPVIGIVQVGVQAHADRYTYLPQIGLAMAMVWWSIDLTNGLASQRRWLAATAAVCVAACCWISWKQTGYWHDGEKLFARAVEYTQGSYVAHNNLGCEFMRQRRYQEAADQFAQAMSVAPRYPLALCNHGNASCQLGRYKEAEQSLRRGLDVDPNNQTAALLLAECLAHLQKLDEAEQRVQQLIANDPRSVQALRCLGLVRERQGRSDEAIALYRRALEIDPTFTVAHFELGSVLYRTGSPAEAMDVLRRAIKLDPNDTDCLRLAAWMAATSEEASVRSGSEAVSWAQQAVRLTQGRDPGPLIVLAASYAEARQFSEAVHTIERAIDAASLRNDGNLVNNARVHLTRYRQGLPWREASAQRKQ